MHTITRLAATLGARRTTAEGMETRDQPPAMQAAGHHAAQGVYIALPQPLPECLAVWRGWTTRADLATAALDLHLVY